MQPPPVLFIVTVAMNIHRLLQEEEEELFISIRMGPRGAYKYYIINTIKYHIHVPRYSNMYVININIYIYIFGVLRTIGSGYCGEAQMRCI